MKGMKERLFWMEMNQEGLDHIGYLMTMDQLLEELPKHMSVKTPEDVDRMFRDADVHNNEGITLVEGEYLANETFTLQELYSMEDVEWYMTWQGFIPEEGFTAVELEHRYPDFVPKELRLSSCVYGDEPGWTRKKLPSGVDNPTVYAYAKELGLDVNKDLEYKYTNAEHAAIVVSQFLQSGDLTEQEFEEIIDSYGISVVKDIEWDLEDTDFTNAEEAGLPACAVLPDEIAEEARNTGDAEVISDWLSDTYGFCHNGFDVDETLRREMSLNREENIRE